MGDCTLRVFGYGVSMKNKRITLVLLSIAALALGGVAGAQGKVDTKTVTTLCVNVETQTEFPSFGDLNLYRGAQRVCIAGKPGKNGKPGKQGKAGKSIKGATGATGGNGKNGVDGKNGDDGKNGKDGDDGKNGKNGVDGKNGVNGQDGADSQVPGPAGPAGADGAPGATGGQGPAGPAGPTGPQGPSGLGNGTVYLCYNASSGSTGFVVPDPAQCNGGHSEYLTLVVQQ